MDFEPHVSIDKFEYALRVVDTHTEGEFTRIVVGGMPEIKGSTMLEKQAYIRDNYDFIRTALMMEPRGHKDMFGAFITEPVHEEADFGVIFMESEAYPNMCGHGTIGCATMAVETGLVKAEEPYTEVVLDAPAGIIRTEVKVEDGRAVSVSLTNVPAFVYAEGLETEVDGKKYTYDIAFGGQFFAMVDVSQTGMDIDSSTVDDLITLGLKIMDNVNHEQEFSHPDLPINDMTSMEFYGPAHEKGNDLRNVVCFGRHQADRSPCGTGTSAKLALLYKHGQVEPGQKIYNESFMGSVFTGEIKEVTKVGRYEAVVPEITGSAYLTGLATYLIDPTDPLKYGFLIG